MSDLLVKSADLATEAVAPKWMPRLARALDLLTLWRSRRRLDDLDDHLLQDIGLSRDIARTEARRPVWDVPRHWRG